jgi:hypothetical protein
MVVSVLPFYPATWAPALAVVAALAAFADPRAGLGIALAVPILPAGNVSLGLAVVYAAVALSWAIVCWRDPRGSLLLAAGPVLALAGALALVPLLAERARGAARRALQGAAAVLLAALVAGLRGVPLPLTGEAPPLGLGIAGSDNPGAVARTLWEALVAHPVVGIEAALLGTAAAALPFVRRRGLLGIAVFGSTLPVAMVLAPPLLGAGAVEPLPALLGSLALTVALAVPLLISRRRV